MRLTSGSIVRKLMVLGVAVAGFVLLYETRMLDSQYFQSMLASSSERPEAGARLRFQATAYCKGTTTASGVRVRSGIAAADPALLPVGSVVNIATGDERYNGVYTVMDTGPKVQGRHVDLYIWSCHEALRFGRREIELTVLRLGWDPTASSPRLVDRLFRGREARRRLPAPEAPPPAGVPPEDGSGPDAEPQAPEIPAGGPAVAPPEPAVQPAPSTKP